MSIEENKAVVGRWFAEFWGPDYNPAVIDELAASEIRFEYSLHAPCRGRDQVREFATKFRAAFPNLAFGATAELIAEGDYVVGQWQGGGTQVRTDPSATRSVRAFGEDQGRNLQLQPDTCSANRAVFPPRRGAGHITGARAARDPERSSAVAVSSGV